MKGTLNVSADVGMLGLAPLLAHFKMAVGGHQFLQEVLGGVAITDVQILAIQDVIQAVVVIVMMLQEQHL